MLERLYGIRHTRYTTPPLLGLFLLEFGPVVEMIKIC